MISRPPKGLKLTVKRGYAHDENIYCELEIYNSSSVDEEIVELGLLSTDYKARRWPLPPLHYQKINHVLAGEKRSIQVPLQATGTHRKIKPPNQHLFYLETKNGAVITETETGIKAVRRKGQFKVFMVFSAIVVVISSLILFRQHHQSSYLATGVINVSHDNNPSKTYQLKVGDPNAKDLLTDSIFVQPATNHWYSFASHDEYTISSASWPEWGETDISKCWLHHS